MAGLEQQAAKDLVASKENAALGKGDSGRGTRGDIDEMDDEESYYKWVLFFKNSEQLYDKACILHNQEWYLVVKYNITQSQWEYETHWE